MASEEDLAPGPAAIFRQHLDHIERGDMSQAKADYAEDAVLEADPTREQGLLLLGTFHGREAAGGDGEGGRVDERKDGSN
jgi:hypothetical protein